MAQTIVDLIEKMLKDPHFADQVISDPRAHQTQYQLNDKTVVALKSIYPQDLAAIRQLAAKPGTDARVLAETMAKIGTEVSWVGQRPSTPDCYYTG